MFQGRILRLYTRREKKMNISIFQSYSKVLCLSNTDYDSLERTITSVFFTVLFFASSLLHSMYLLILRTPFVLSRSKDSLLSEQKHILT